MRTVIDTNIIISTAIFKSKRMAQVLDIAKTRGTVLLPQYAIEEAREKARVKFAQRAGLVDELLATLEHETIPNPVGDLGVDLRISDPKDLPILRAAVAAGADAIVSGDKRFHAPETDTHGIPTYTPAEFVEHFATIS